MDGYPSEYIEHNLPLVALSGLGEQHQKISSTTDPPFQGSGTRILGSSPECTGERAHVLLREFLSLDGSRQPWNSSALPGPNGKLKYKMRTIGRSYSLPPRKAAPLAQATSAEGSRGNSGSPQIMSELHSPLSPLSPGSPLYPDGVFTPLWLSKHQQQVPALFIAFFDIVTASTINSNQDENIKADINAIRTSLIRSGFKTKFAAVLISDRSIVQAPELEDRLLSIRRLTSLDSKTGLFFIPPMSAIELSTFVQSMMTTLQPLIIDYYRDLTKHARRKKGRVSSASLPSSVGSQSAPLPVMGWNVRYEVKQGVFAEFRQEMETAERHYSAAIDELFSAEGVLEFYPTSSLKWTEACVLCDCLALRILRCQLWTSLTSAAVLSWVNYKLRMKDLLSRRGGELRTHGWEAWKAKWLEIMAQLINRADLPVFRNSAKQQDDSVEMASGQMYAMPEKSLNAAERIPPFHHLHHSGYWLRTATKASRAAREGATKVSEGDEVSPRQSPVSHRARNEVPYHSADPPKQAAHDDLADITRLTQAAIEQFEGKAQVRMIELVKLDLAHDFVDAERYDSAAEILIPLWEDTTWRDDGWEDLFADLLLLLRQCAERLRNCDVVLGTTYELLSARPSAIADRTFDLTRCLDGVVEGQTDVVSLKIQDQQRLSPVAVSFVFETKETHVGEPLGCQMSIISRVNDETPSLTLSSITLSFGTSKFVRLVHDAGLDAPTTELVELSEIAANSESTYEAKTNLTLQAKQRRLYNFSLRFRDPLIVRLRQAAISIETNRFAIEHSFTEPALLESDSVLIQNAETLERRFLRNAEPIAVTVLPKPPKVQILLHGLRKEYYTDEAIRLDVDIVNSEGEPITGKVSAQVNGERDTALALRWIEEDESENTEGQTQHAPIIKIISELKRDQTYGIGISITAPPDPLETSIEISIDYTLFTDTSASLRKSLTLDLNFIKPFEAKFNFGPLLYPDAWPNFFDPNGGTTDERPGGVPQLWRLSNQLRCRAAEKIVLRKVDVLVESVNGDSRARFKSADSEEMLNIEPGQLSRYAFKLETQKYSLDDRRPTAIESTLAITWSRDSSSSAITTRLPIPRLSLPVSEPRVLCTFATESLSDARYGVLRYHIENPSVHFLTFAVTMEASEDFAFSGPKFRTLSLSPMSRHRIEYQIALQDADDAEGRWISPSLQVVDSYYQKTLRVHPAGDGVRLDEKGSVEVWIKSS